MSDIRKLCLLSESYINQFHQVFFEMCFAPQISLITALVEFFLAIIIFFKFKKSLVSKFASVFIFLLGLYQFTEFLLCTVPPTDVWIRLGFITYTFLPALSLHFVVRLINSKAKVIWAYVIPIVASVVAIFFKGFAIGSACHKFFVSTQLMFFTPKIHTVVSMVYGCYYFGFIVLASILALRKFLDEKNAPRKKIILVGLIGVWLATLPAFIFVLVLPAFSVQFPSVYCEFALLMAIAGYVVTWMDYDERNKKK